MNAGIRTAAYRNLRKASASLGFNVHYHAQSHRHKQLSYLLKSSYKIENYSMCKLSDRLFGFVVIFNLDKRFFFKDGKFGGSCVIKNGK